MSAQLVGIAGTGLTNLVAVGERDADGHVWSTVAVAWVVYDSSDIADYAVALTEGVPGRYYASNPDSATASTWRIIQKAGSPLVVNDLTAGLIGFCSVYEEDAIATTGASASSAAASASTAATAATSAALQTTAAATRAALGMAAANLDTQLAAIGSGIPSAAAIVAAWQALTLPHSSKTYADALEFIICAVGAGKTSGATAPGAQTWVIRNLDNSANLASIANDGTGNRSTVTW